MDYYCYMFEGLWLVLIVVEDVDYLNVIGVFWGEINMIVYKGFGVFGVLINGVMCDFGDLLVGFLVVVGLIGLSYGYVYVKEINMLVKIFGFDIYLGEFVYVDCYGVFVVLQVVVLKLGDVICKLLEMEKLVLELVCELGFDFVVFEKVWFVFEKVWI